jgi:RNA polymerase sigma-70 factor (ECF subfamily)
MVPDARLIEECIKGKRKAFNLLYKKYAAAMLGVCIRYCHNREDAEDVLQDGFIKVFENIGRFRQEGSLEGWIRRIIVRTAIDHLHQDARFHFLQELSGMEESQLPDETSNEGWFEEDPGFSAGELLQMIQSLPPGYRIVFNLYALEGYPHNEIAEMLNISVSTSKTQLFKARNTLKKRIESLLYNQVNHKVK